MARPTIFVSSTYYDLKYIRAGIEAFISNLGYQPVLFEAGAITFHHDQTLEASCLKGVAEADMLVLIIGGRYGSLSKEDEETIQSKSAEVLDRIRSVTNKEYLKARELDIPVFIFVESSVLSEYETFKHNKANETIRFVHVDDRRIYDMIDDILIQKRNNFVRGFSTLEDITTWLRDQWSGIFAELIRKKNVDQKLKSLGDQIDDLTDVIATLKTYNEEIIRAVTQAKSDEIIHRESKRASSVRADRFVLEPLIEHLIKTYEPRLASPELLLDCFIESPDLRAFMNSALKKAGNDFISTHGGTDGEATKEFDRLKERYKPPLIRMREFKL